MREFCVGDVKIAIDETHVVELFDAVVVVLFSSDKFVLVRNEKRAWEFPGGHREGNESYVETAAREAYEETGVKIADIEYLGYYTMPNGMITIITRANVSSSQTLIEDKSDVALFDQLPPDLSFGDGREQLFLEYALQVRQDR